MGVAAKEFGIRVLKAILVNAIGYLGWKAIKNTVVEGKTVFGRDRPAEQTYVDWKGDVILGPNDGTVK